MPLEPKLMRCSKGTRRNKKTGLCEPTLRGSNSLGKVITVPKGNPSPIAMKLKETKVLRCPKGTRRNKKTGICDPTLKTRIGEHTSDKEGENPFIALCKKYIMKSRLDNVDRKVWLNKEDCNIFIIGEHHKPHERCTSILDMFRKLFRENDKNPVLIDLLVEVLPTNIDHYAEKNKKYPYTSKDSHIYHVREYLAPCIQTKCSFSKVHVHWADSSEDVKDRLHKWLKEFNKLPIYGDGWVNQNPDISRILQNKSDVSKILTENVTIVKEIEKASKIPPYNFTMKFATDLLIYFLDQSRAKLTMEIGMDVGWQVVVPILQRRVMDFYTAARIIKSKFKNVIFYAGDSHAEHVIDILTKLGFSVVDTVLGDEKCINY